MDDDERPLVVILGAGINGAACARELLLNRVPVCVVDSADIASGATSKSTRLIHGGLRYLEFGEWSLVRESVRERTRLLRLAPQFVRPLRLCIPLENRFGNLWGAAARFLGFSAAGQNSRGLWLVRIGLRMYEMFVTDKSFARHAVHRLGEGDLPEVAGDRFRWLCDYGDAQIVSPERFVVALLEDCRRIALENDTGFDLHTYSTARLVDGNLEITGSTAGSQPLRVKPALLINASGAWGDETLRSLDVESKRLFGGTKGSHLLTAHAGLKQALHGYGLYSEAADGRLIFVLPFGQQMLIGTTDMPFSGPPDRAIAGDDEIAYLIGAINALFPNVNFKREDVILHYSGVRPLPYAPARNPGAVTRRHGIEENESGTVPVFTIIGGKLTTCRSLAEETANRVLARWDLKRIADSRNRCIPGSSGYPASAQEMAQELDRIAARFGLMRDQVAAVWELFGTGTARVLEDLSGRSDRNLIDTSLPLGVVRWVIRNEWVQKLTDLVERRLMLVFQPRLTEACVRELAQLLAEEDVTDPHEADEQIAETLEHLRVHFGRRLEVEA